MLGITSSDGGALACSPGTGGESATSRSRILRSGAMIPLTGPPAHLTAAAGFGVHPSSTAMPGPSAPVLHSMITA